jgi:hypothetical protein
VSILRTILVVVVVVVVLATVLSIIGWVASTLALIVEIAIICGVGLLAWRLFHRR